MFKPKIKEDFKYPSNLNEIFFGASNDAGIILTPNSGFRTFYPKLNIDNCIKCMKCWIFCPEGCIDKSTGEIQIDLDFCKGCGICEKECPKECIKMVKEGD